MEPFLLTELEAVVAQLKRDLLADNWWSADNQLTSIVSLVEEIQSKVNEKLAEEG